MGNAMRKHEIRKYDRRKSAVFRKTTEKWGGLSNMAAGFPLFINGMHIRTCEALYQACRFPDLPEVQEKIISQSSPMTAKMVGKPYRDQTRKDWDESRVLIMKWCLRVKLVQNWTNFGKLLKETKNLDIVESSDKDGFWGAKPIDMDCYEGVNALGRLLMELREQLFDYNASPLEIVSAPQIENFLLLGSPITQACIVDSQIVNGSQHSMFDV